MKYEKKDFDFKKYGCFFAFSNEQFEKQRKQGVKYSCTSWGLIIPKGTEKEVFEEFAKFNKKEAKRRLKIEGLKKIIKYELLNHEIHLSYDFSQVEFLKDMYGATDEDIQSCYAELLEQDNFIY